MTYLLACLLLALPATAAQRDVPVDYRLQVLPPGEQLTLSAELWSTHWSIDTPGIPTVRCYTFEEYKGLLIYDDELACARKLLDELGRVTAAQGEQIEEYKAKEKILREEYDRIQEKWAKADVQFQEDQAAFPWTPVLFGVGGTLALTSAILLTLLLAR